MGRERSPVLTALLCIALVFILLPFLGAIGPTAAASGSIHGTIRADDITTGPGLNGITVFISRRADGWSTMVVSSRNGNSDGYYTSGTLQDPSDQGFNVSVNRNSQRGYTPEYSSSKHTGIRVSAIPVIDNHVLNHRNNPSKVTLSGKVVADAGGKPLKDIRVFFWRQDGKDAHYQMTDAEGNFVIQVERSDDPGKRYTIVANRNNSDGNYNTAWYNSTEQVNIQPDRDHHLPVFLLPTANITLSGRVTDEMRGMGVNGIEVCLWRQNSQEAACAITKSDRESDGEWNIELSRSVYMNTPDPRFHLMANRNDPGHSQSSYLNSTDRVILLPDHDQSGLDLQVFSRTVTFSGMVKDQKGAPLPGIEVFLRRHDGKSWKVSTGPDGKWSAAVDRSTSIRNPDHRINITANEYGAGFTPSTDYPASTEVANRLPDRDQSIASFSLSSRTVSLSGNVTDDISGTGIAAIGVQIMRNADGAMFCSRTDSGGLWRVVVPRSGERYATYTITANPVTACLPSNPGYSTSAPKISGTPDFDQTGINFYIQPVPTTTVPATLTPTVPPASTPMEDPASPSTHARSLTPVNAG